MELTERAAYLKGLIEGLGIDETTKEGKIIKAMNELLGELSTAVMGLDEDLTQAYDLINDLNDEIEDLEADLYEEDEEQDSQDDDEEEGDDDEPFYEVACPNCGQTVYVSEDDLDVGEAICPSCKVAFGRGRSRPGGGRRPGPVRGHLPQLRRRLGDRGGDSALRRCGLPQLRPASGF